MRNKIKFNLIIFCAISIFLMPSALSEIQQYNYTVNVYSATDLNDGYIFDWNQSVILNGSNEVVEVECDSWIVNCFSPLMIGEDIEFYYHLLVPNTTKAGHYVQNVTFLNVTNLSVEPKKIEFMFDVTYYYNITPEPIINTTNTTLNVTVNTTGPHSASGEGANKYKYLQNDLPLNFIKTITILGDNQTVLNIKYDSWLKGPSSVKIIYGRDKHTSFDVNISIPKIGMGKYSRNIKLTNPLTNLTKTIELEFEIRAPEYDYTKLENWDDLTEDQKADFFIEYFNDYKQNFMDKMTDDEKKVIEKYSIAPVSYEYLADLVKQANKCDEDLVNDARLLSKGCSSLSDVQTKELKECKGSTGELIDENTDLRTRNLYLANIQNNHSLIISTQEQDLKDYDKRTVKKSTFFIFLIPTLVLAGAFAYPTLRDLIEDSEVM